MRLDEVSNCFGDNLILDRVSTTVNRGEATLVAGPSGSGKSTMLRCINGLYSIDSGDITFDGRAITK